MKQKICLSFAPLLATHLIAACGPSTQRPTYDEFEDPSGQHVFLKAAARCQNSSDCSPSVGMVLSRADEDHYIDICTAYLTDDGYLATNDHCIPRRFQNGSSCYRDIEFFLPGGNQYAPESVRCDHVAWRSSDQNNNDDAVFDIAFLKLTRQVSRPTLQISHDEVDYGDQVKLYSVNPDNIAHQLTGAAVTRKCRVLRSIAAGIGFVLTESLLDLCNIVHGNSGSPVVGSDERVYGIAHHSMHGDTPTLASGDGESKRNFTSSGGHVSATDAACFKVPSESSYQLPARCHNR